MKIMKKKNKHAQAMAKKRWKKTTKKERSKMMSELAKKRWRKEIKDIEETCKITRKIIDIVEGNPQPKEKQNEMRDMPERE